MELGRFSPGEFNLDDERYDEIEISLRNVEASEFHDLVMALKKLTHKQVIAAREPEVSDEPEEPEEPEDMSGKIIDIVKENKKITAASVAKMVFTTKNRKKGFSKHIRKLMKEMACRGILLSTTTPGGATYYELVDDDTEPMQ